jgi:DNA invertase Pin-like site-specific DNA recombinase
LIDTDPQLQTNFQKVLQDHTAGDPMKPDALWTNLSLSAIAERMGELGTPVGPSIVEQLLGEANLGRRQAFKTVAMGPTPDRNQQFEIISFYKVLDELRERNVGLVSLRDGALDPTTPTGRLIYTILSSVATYETEVRKERQLAGIQAVRMRNGGKCPWGGSKTGRRLKVTQEKEALIKKLQQDGKKITAIAKLVGLSRQTCHSVLAITSTRQNGR